MNFFYFYFLISYVLYSTIGLIVDIFFDEQRITKLDINLIKTSYCKAYNNVSKNVLLVSIPFFIIAELMYLNYTFNDNIFTYIYQYTLTIILGLNLDYLINIFKHSEWFYKYHKHHHNSKELFGFMCYDQHIYDFCLSMIVVIFPALFRFNPLITITWIIVYLYNNMIINYCDLKILGKHYNIHHNFIHYNYGFIIIDYILDTYSIGNFKSNKNNLSDINDKNSDDEFVNLDNFKQLTNEEYYKYLCKTNRHHIKKPLFGQLHYSNFF
jgi:sterol desaturase/sphingolipid hydroxylase (fatty acid hydroxylase superfamily)